ncbi:ATP-binding protein [Polyangium aurulentum]|uniref:ATP-binding protein n=1 Tax=Polyangium aurulentum TaxID=2567896 RepID=UPI0010AEB84C|nr:ATP-binding protein [Polyangium aurulentum]UQA57756.1 ATP-binding protein [Polyangium aurulentum]
MEGTTIQGRAGTGRGTARTGEARPPGAMPPGAVGGGRVSAFGRRRRFNVDGPCSEELHYMLAPEARVGAARARLERGDYLAVHGPRQGGKTTWLRAMARSLLDEGRFAALVVPCRGAGLGDPAAEERALVGAIDRAAREDLPEALRPPPFPPEYDARFVGVKLASWARRCPRPLVLLFDDVDALSARSLGAVLGGIRAGHAARPRAAPWALVVSGARDVTAAGDPLRDVLAPLPLPDFSRAEVAALYAQHTAESGQPFTDEAVESAFALSGGRPWVVNALGREVVERMRPPLSGPIEKEHIEAARLRLAGG